MQRCEVKKKKVEKNEFARNSDSRNKVHYYQRHRTKRIVYLSHCSTIGDNGVRSSASKKIAKLYEINLKKKYPHERRQIAIYISFLFLLCWLLSDDNNGKSFVTNGNIIFKIVTSILRVDRTQEIQVFFLKNNLKIFLGKLS